MLQITTFTSVHFAGVWMIRDIICCGRLRLVVCRIWPASCLLMTGLLQNLRIQTTVHSLMHTRTKESHLQSKTNTPTYCLNINGSKLPNLSMDHRFAAIRHIVNRMSQSPSHQNQTEIIWDYSSYTYKHQVQKGLLPVLSIIWPLLWSQSKNAQTKQKEGYTGGYGRITTVQNNSCHNYIWSTITATGNYALKFTSAETCCVYSKWATMPWEWQVQRGKYTKT